MWFDAAWDGRSAAPVQIYGPPATRFLLQAALNYLSVSERIFGAGGPALAPAASFFQAHDILGNAEVYRDSRVTVIAVANTHYNFRSGTAASGQDLSFSYRFNTARASVVFTGDTGPSDVVTDLARNADVLVSEVCLCDPRTKGPAVPGSKARAGVPTALQRQKAFHMHHEHLTPEEVGKMAAAAHVKVVILTHFVPGGDKLDPAQYTAGVMRYFSGPVIRAEDLFEYDLR